MIEVKGDMTYQGALDVSDTNTVYTIEHKSRIDYTEHT